VSRKTPVPDRSPPPPRPDPPVLLSIRRHDRADQEDRPQGPPAALEQPIDAKGGPLPAGGGSPPDAAVDAPGGWQPCPTVGSRPVRADAQGLFFAPAEPQAFHGPQALKARVAARTTPAGLMQLVQEYVRSSLSPRDRETLVAHHKWVERVRSLEQRRDGLAADLAREESALAALKAQAAEPRQHVDWFDRYVETEDRVKVARLRLAALTDLLAGVSQRPAADRTEAERLRAEALAARHRANEAERAADRAAALAERSQRRADEVIHEPRAQQAQGIRDLNQRLSHYGLPNVEPDVPEDDPQKLQLLARAHADMSHEANLAADRARQAADEAQREAEAAPADAPTVLVGVLGAALQEARAHLKAEAERAHAEVAASPALARCLEAMALCAALERSTPSDPARLLAPHINDLAALAADPQPEEPNP
jgi:hypothetical protein